MASTVAQYSTVASVPAFHEANHNGRYQGGGHIHERGAQRGYLVVRTDWSEGMDSLKREPIAFFEIEAEYRAGSAKWTNAYSEALDCVRTVRAAAGDCQYGVIDHIYDCGCRFIG